MIKNALWLFVAASIVLLVFLPSYSKFQDLKQRNNDYADEIKRLKDNNIKMAKEIMRLENDPIYLEKIAREKMGLVRDGEVVYKLTPATQNKIVPPAPNKTLPKDKK